MSIIRAKFLVRIDGPSMSFEDVVVRSRAHEYVSSDPVDSIEETGRGVRITVHGKVFHVPDANLAFTMGEAEASTAYECPHGIVLSPAHPERLCNKCSPLKRDASFFDVPRAPANSRLAGTGGHVTAPPDEMPLKVVAGDENRFHATDCGLPPQHSGPCAPRRHQPGCKLDPAHEGKCQRQKAAFTPEGV